MDDCLITNNFRQLGAGRGGELVSININKSVIIIILTELLTRLIEF